MEWNYVVIIISALLALWVILKEVRRKARKNLSLRLAASIIAVTALTLIALPPTYKRKSNTSGERAIILLTDGFSKDSLSAFTEPLVIATDPELLKSSGAKSQQRIPAIDYYLAANPEVKKLHILGSGLPDDELQFLKNTNVQFHKPGVISGFQKVNWKEKIKSGEELWVSGCFNNTWGKEVKIQLKGLSTVLDSAIISPDSLATFQLSCSPRQLGTAVNYLVVTSGKDSLFTEKIPFEVEPVKPLNIFIVSAFPDFEVNFLKQWLAGSNFSVAVRNKISTGKFSTEFVNMDAIPLNFQSGSLEKFDVLIADETSVLQLSQSERLAVSRQVNQGMGLLIRNEEEVKLPGFFGASFPASPMADQENLSVSIPGSRYQMIIPGKGVNYLAPQAYDQPLVRDSKDHILVSSTISGLGRIIFSTINNTYFLKLSGKSSEYSSFWSFLIEKAARKKQSKEHIKIAERFPVVHEETRVLLQTGATSLPKLFAGDSRVSLAQNAELPNWWKGSFWPGKAGWNTVKTADGLSTNVFVFNPMDWLSVRHVQNFQATRKFAEQSGREPKEVSPGGNYSNEQIPPIFFYLLLLACCSYLWIETKFL
ncbi:hypothetical protein GZH53_03190 [Flavihumibacter sp. R14]|nr:hypothetical protein [Flavihumibacter soli]